MNKKTVFGLFVFAMISLFFLNLANASSTSNWWDKFGEPQYGDTITVRATVLSTAFDLKIFSAEHFWFYWWENLFINDQLVSPDVYDFKIGSTPDKYIQGLLAESWEMTGPTTLVVKIHKGIHYANKPPANSREFTAEDVQYHYDRAKGTGSGFTEPNPQYRAYFAFIKKVTATDKYTVVFEFTQPSALNFTNLTALGHQIECRESVEASGGAITDWNLAVGTGPYILTDVVAGSSFTYTRNPDYWGNDERHPENQLPYADNIKVLLIKDMSTALAGMRSGKIDLLPNLDWKQVKALERTNPELTKVTFKTGGHTMEYPYDTPPFTDIRVRKALQMAVNLQEIAQVHYGGTIDPLPNGHVSQYWKGYCYPYNEWPQSLKDEYSYNPERAKQLLAEAAAEDVFKVNKYGGFDTNCMAPNNTDIELIEIMKGYFMEVGVDMEIRTMDYLTFQASCRQGLNDGLIMHTWGNSGASGMTIMLDFAPNSTRNLGRIHDPEIDQLYIDYSTATKYSDLAPIFRQLDKVYLEKHMRLQTFNIENYLMHQPYLKGYNGENTLSGPYTQGWPLARMWIDRNIKK